MSLTRCCGAPRRTRRRPALHRVLTQNPTRESSPRHRHRIARKEAPSREFNPTQHSSSVRQPGFREPQPPLPHTATAPPPKRNAKSEEQTTATTTHGPRLCAPALRPVCPFGDVRRQANSSSCRNSSRRERTHAGAELRQTTTEPRVSGPRRPLTPCTLETYVRFFRCQIVCLRESWGISQYFLMTNCGVAQVVAKDPDLTSIARIQRSNIP